MEGGVEKDGWIWKFPGKAKQKEKKKRVRIQIDGGEGGKGGV